MNGRNPGNKLRNKPNPSRIKNTRPIGGKKNRGNAPLLAVLFIAALLTLIASATLLFTVLNLKSGAGEESVTTPESSSSDTEGTTDAAPPDTEATTDTAPPDTEVTTGSAPPDTTASEVPGISASVLGETPDAGQKYIDRIVFLGDSRTYGLKTYRMLKDGRETDRVWTPESGTLSIDTVSSKKIYYPAFGGEVAIPEAVAEAKPEIMVLSIGFNYAGGTSAAGWSTEKQKAYFINEYRKLVNIIRENSPETIIILQSLYPVYGPLYSGVTNKTVNERNAWILETAEDTGVYYLDTQAALRDENGDLPKNCQNGDGYHLNETGYGIILDYIRTHAVPE